MKKIYEDKKIILIIGGIVFFIILLILYLVNNKDIKNDIALNISTEKITTKNEEKESFYVDVKGNINNPGVYKVKENSTVQEAIIKAGGLKKNSYTDNINLSRKVTDEMVIYIFNKEYINKLKEIKSCKCTPIYKYDNCTDKENEIIKTNTSTTKITTIPEIITTTIKESTTIKETTSKISTIEPQVTTKKQTSTTTTTQKKLDIININIATVEELCELHGLGQKKAEAIIEYRNNNGLFKTIEDILNVSGIGESTFEKIKDYIKV